MNGTYWLVLAGVLAVIGFIALAYIHINRPQQEFVPGKSMAITADKFTPVALAGSLFVNTGIKFFFDINLAYEDDDISYAQYKQLEPFIDKDMEMVPLYAASPSNKLEDFYLTSDKSTHQFVACHEIHLWQQKARKVIPVYDLPVAYMDAAS